MKIHLHESTLKAIAEAIAARTTIRTYTDGTSNDNTRQSSPAERAAIFPVTMGALLTINYHTPTDAYTAAVLDMAEYTLMQAVPRANTYDTIYNPLQAVLEAWRAASEGTPSYLTQWAAAAVWRLFPDWHDFIRSVFAYESEESFVPLPDLNAAADTVASWHKAGIDTPSPDAGLLFVLYNLYVLEHKAGRE